MKKLFYTDKEVRKDEDGYDETYVYVPELDEWMTEDEFAFQKACYNPAVEEANTYYAEHGSDDWADDDEEDEDDDWDVDYEEDDEYDDTGWDEAPKTKEEAWERYNQTGVNHSEFDLNDYDEINRLLGFEFIKTKK